MVLEPGGRKTTRLCVRVNKVTARNKKGIVKSISFRRYVGDCSVARTENIGGLAPLIRSGEFPLSCCWCRFSGLAMDRKSTS